MIPRPLLVHADWSFTPKKRWMAMATPGPTGRYLAAAPVPVGSLGDLADRLMEQGPCLLGVDFPIGLPRAYAGRTGITSFLDWLRGAHPIFFEPAETIDQIGLERPFYPRYARSGVSRLDLLRQLNFTETRELYRACDLATADRRTASAMFWTLGAQQVGKGALIGWRDLVRPALNRRRDIGIWPYDGDLEALIATRRLTLAETYPAEFLAGLLPGRRPGKRSRHGRHTIATAWLAWAEAADLDLEPTLSIAMGEGFGTGADAEDRIDCCLGLACLVDVLSGRRPSAIPDDPLIRSVEGWILGQRFSPGG